MRWLTFALLVLTWDVSAAQGQIFSGNWRLNVAKSHLGQAATPVSVVIVIDHHEPVIQYHGAVLYVDDDTREFDFTGAFDSKPYKVSRSYGDGMITLVRIDHWTFDSTFRSNDRNYVETGRTSISRDGKTLTRKLTMRAPDGNKSWIEVYDKV